LTPAQATLNISTEVRLKEGDQQPDRSSNDEVSEETDVFPIDFTPAATPRPPAVPPYVQPSAEQQPSAPYPTSYPGYTPVGGQPGYGTSYGEYGQPYQPYQPYAQDRSRGATGTGGKVVLFVLGVLLVVFVGVITGLVTGLIAYSDLARLLGMGPAEIYVQNLRDESISVSVQRLDSGGSVVIGREDRLGSGDVRAYPGREPGPWNVRFVADGGAEIGRCELNAAGNGRYTFMVLPEVIVISSAGQAPGSGDDLVVGQSPLCSRS
jgi:hypothetical protein